MNIIFQIDGGLGNAITPKHDLLSLVAIQKFSLTTRGLIEPTLLDNNNTFTKSLLPIKRLRFTPTIRI
jgi:hypothetical protein